LTATVAEASPPQSDPVVPPVAVVVRLPKDGPPVPPASPVAVVVTGEAPQDYVTPRYEPAGLPLIGGNSDIGFMFGAAATLTRFDGGAKPYAWNMDLVLSTSIKGGAGSNGGLGFAQQNYLWNWDIPDLLGGRVRLNPVIYYQRTVDQGYFGLGDGSSAVAQPGSQRFFQYLDNEVRAQQYVRIAMAKGFDFVLVPTFRAEDPTVYPGTQLALDAAAKNPDGTPLLRGVQPAPKNNSLGIGMLSAGVVYDSRDDEIFPRSGAFHQLGVKVAQGLPADQSVQYGELGGNFSLMVPLLGRAVVFASRFVADFEVGNVPFYDLYTGGVFQSNDMPGGSRGIRGVPSGRYLGRIKAIANVELRTLPLSFHLLGQSFHAGADVFFDTGRIWLDYTFRSPRDQSPYLGLKYGTGAGLYFVWGQAAIFRVEAAYSPDQAAENPSFPVGIYVEDGVMF
jgi:outer membrane protein assembly factor BamA